MKRHVEVHSPPKMVLKVAYKSCQKKLKRTAIINKKVVLISKDL